jgi:sugar/nucleoside kinase (ribokinase family)
MHVKPRVVCVGDVMVDVAAHLPGPLAVGSDTPAPITVHGGGSAANTAAWLAVCDVPCTLVARVGDDVLGRWALDELRLPGLDLAVTVDRELATGTCLVLVDPDGERTMVPSAGANALGGTARDFAPTDHLHVSGYALFHEASRGRVLDALARARATGCSVSVDAASSEPLREFGPRRFLDAVAPALLFANVAEAAVFAGTRDVESAVRLLGLRCGEAVVKCGADGALWSDGKRVVRVPAVPVVPTDSTGAGDAFAAGVLAARLQAAPVDEALRAGAELAARAIAKPGGRP